MSYWEIVGDSLVVLGKVIGNKDDWKPSGALPYEEPFKSFIESFGMVFYDHAEGNTYAWKNGNTYLVAHCHCEHYHLSELVWLLELVVNNGFDIEIILWDEYWEKLMFKLKVKK